MLTDELRLVYAFEHCKGMDCPTGDQSHLFHNDATRRRRARHPIAECKPC
jgi:hypothetical protein